MEAPPSLPLDVIVQILARSDPVTIARGAATCKQLRHRVVTGLDFWAPLQRSADRFLVGIMYRRGISLEEFRVSPLISPARSPSAWPPIPVASFMSRTADLFDTHRLVASSDGLLVLTTRRRDHEDRPLEVCVCDPVTGNRASFPPPETVSGHVYVLLPLEDDGRTAGLSSFRLVAADKAARTQTFSSAEGSWGPPVTGTLELPVRRHSTELVQPLPVVLGGVAYWLYRQIATKRGPFHVVALDVRTGQATSFEVPEHCLRRLRVHVAYKELLLARSADGGKLMLVVAESTALSVWTVPEDAAGRWVRSVLIETASILTSVAPQLPPIGCQGIEFEWFGEKSGSVVFQMHGVGLLVLNLRTKHIHQLHSSRTKEFQILCPYELDFVSLFAAQRKNF